MAYFNQSHGTFQLFYRLKKYFKQNTYILQIRQAVSADLEQIKEIDTVSFGFNTYPVFVLRQFLDISDGLVKVAEVENKVVGNAIGHHNHEKSESWFLSLGVLPDYRGQKVGEGLTDALLQDVRARNARKVMLTVNPENLAGVKIYERLGFEKEQFEENYYQDNSPRIIMSKIFVN